MVEIIQSETFQRWRSGLRDRAGLMRINARLRRVEQGNFGDAKPVGQGVSELRIDFGPGYRVYFMQRGAVLVVLLAGGDKSTQQADIAKAIALANDYKE